MKPRIDVASLLLAGALACAPAAVGAQSGVAPPTSVDLPAVLRLVRDASPRLALERQAIAAAEANRITAGAYPNPSVTFGRLRPSGGQATLFEGSHQDAATIELPLLIAGQRSARVERAERDIEAARARVDSGAGSLAAEAGAAYVGLLAAQERSALVGAANVELARLRDLVAGREALGAASRYDRTRLDVELGGARAKLDDAQAEVASRAGALAALLGLPDWRPTAAGTLTPLALEPAALERPRERATTSPAAIAALREESAAQSGVEVARRERWPVPSVTAGRSWTSDPYGAANFLGLSVEIPILDTRRGALARAESEAAAAALRRQLAQIEAAATLERLAEVIVARQAALRRFEDEAAARLPALQQMAEDAYRLGRGSVLELLDATRARYDLLQARVDLAAALLEAQVRYLATAGDLESRLAPAATR